MLTPVPHGRTRPLSGKGSNECSDRSTTVRSLCRASQWMRLPSWQMPPPSPAVASPLRSRIPVTYPLRAVQFPTARLNENVSPGRDEEAVDVGAGETEVDDLVLLQIDLVGSELATQQRRVLA